MGMSLTAEEQYRLHRCVYGENAIELLDLTEKVEELDGLDGTVREAKGQYPNEDFLQDVIRRLEVLGKTTRGENRNEVFAILSMVQEIQRDVHGSTEYGLSELEKVEKALEELQ